MEETAEFIVAELDCADEARQIQEALGRLGGAPEVRTAVGARKAFVVYDSARVEAEAIRNAIRGLGMTIADARSGAERRWPRHGEQGTDHRRIGARGEGDRASPIYAPRGDGAPHRATGR